jgi:hypothetical protein
MQLTPKSASVVSPEDGRLRLETCRALRHNKVIGKVNVCKVGYVIVIFNDTGQQNVKNDKQMKNSATHRATKMLYFFVVANVVNELEKCSPTIQI